MRKKKKKPSVGLTELTTYAGILNDYYGHAFRLEFPKGFKFLGIIDRDRFWDLIVRETDFKIRKMLPYSGFPHWKVDEFLNFFQEEIKGWLEFILLLKKNDI